MKDKLMTSFFGGGAEVYYMSTWAPRGVPGRVQKQTRTPPGSEISEILKIKFFFKENIGFGRSRGAPGGSGRAPGRCLREHFGAPWILREPLMVPGYEFGVPLGPPGIIVTTFWSPRELRRAKLCNLLMHLI